MHFRTFRLQPRYAPLFQPYFFAPGRLGLRFALFAIGGSSDFAHSQQSRQSHKAVSSSLWGPPLGPSVYGLSFHFQLLSTPPRGDAVTFSYWRLAPPERDFHPLALTAPKRTSADILVRRWTCGCRGLAITQRRTRMSALQSPVPTTLEKSKLRTGETNGGF